MAANDHGLALSRLQRRAERERQSRLQAEQLLEDKSRELYHAHQALQEWSATLEERVVQRTEELERQTRELQTLIKDRERFTANVTHELRTPLQGILGFAKLGGNRADTAQPQKIAKWFSTIEKSGETLLLLVNNLLDIAKLDANMMEINPQQFSVAELFEDVHSEFALRCKDRSVTLTLEGDAEIALMADQFRMGQVFRNLIGNALKFCNPSSSITMQVSEESQVIELRIVNQGLRIPDEEAGKVFEAFVESTATQSAAGGTGLGLAICKQIIEAHQGCIWLDTTHPDTCFVVELPQTVTPANIDETTDEPADKTTVAANDIAANNDGADDYLAGGGGGIAA